MTLYIDPLPGGACYLAYPRLPELSLNKKEMRENYGTNLKVIGMAPKKDERLSIPALGEWYDDLLRIDAWSNNRTMATQGQNLLYAKLQEREARIKERVNYFAKKRGISFDEMWNQILTGKAERLIQTELIQVEEESEAEND